MAAKKNKLLRFMTTKRNAGRYSKRVVPLGNRPVGSDGGVSDGDGDEPQKVFIDNEIRTSKYRWYTFIFK